VPQALSGIAAWGFDQRVDPLERAFDVIVLQVAREQSTHLFAVGAGESLDHLAIEASDQLLERITSFG
jgi:hypothetical protein